MMNINEVVFRVIDTETTGLDHSKDAVVEVAYVDCAFDPASDKFWVEGVYEELVNPLRPIPPEASAIHHLTDVDVAGAWTLDKMEPSITRQYPDGRQVVYVAHNAAFDSAFLPFVEAPWLCTLRLASHLLPDQESHRNQYLRYSLGLDVPEAKGLPAHRALADVWVTKAILGYLLRMTGIGVSVEDLIRLANSPVPQTTMRFGNKHRGEKWADVPLSYLHWMRDKVTDLDPDTKWNLERELHRRRGMR